MAGRCNRDLSVSKVVLERRNACLLREPGCCTAGVRFMKVLYYNWVDYLDDEKRGGGVTVYQRNLMRAWAQEADVEANFISSGISYDVRPGPPRWEQVRHGPDENRAHRFEIVNSGVQAPAHHAFGVPAQISDDATQQVFADFLRSTGPYDVVHFNNLEGIPADVLRLKDQFPQTKFILSLHNYYAVCPQVNLWHREVHACTDFDAGRACVDCLIYRPDMRLVRLANGLAYRLKCWGIRPGSRSFDLLFRQSLRIGGRAARLAGRLRRRRPVPQPKAERAQVFAQRRPAMIDAINTGCDAVLGVSARVCAIAAQYGIKEDLLHTSYIGTAHAAYFANTEPAAALLAEDGTLRVAYLGYMRPDKGFFFLLDALEALPDAVAARLHVLVAAQAGPQDLMKRLMALSPRLASLTHVDGYTPEGLDGMLADVDLGLIPVMWEDNLPQVAIEMHARHIPLLTSDMGGASELGGPGALVHKAGDVGSFGAELARVLSGEADMEAYWSGARAPVSMAEHVAALKELYRGGQDD